MANTNIQPTHHSSSNNSVHLRPSNKDNNHHFKVAQELSQFKSKAHLLHKVIIMRITRSLCRGKINLMNFNYKKSSVVNQFYDPTLMPSEFVMRGNSAIMKCSIPSFVADFVYVTAWIDDEGNEIVPSEDAMSESASKIIRNSSSLKHPGFIIFPLLYFP